MYSQESVEMLRAAGLDLNRLQNEIISMDIFGELLTTSGLIVDDRITWLTFSFGYDFGYLLKSVALGELPQEESQFFQFHRALFHKCYDIKLMLRMPFNTKLKGCLQEVCSHLLELLKRRMSYGARSTLPPHDF